MKFSKWEEWNEYEREAFKVWLRGVLTTEEVSVTFVKRDGSERVMKATLKENAIPDVEKKTNRTRAPNKDVISVVDMEIGEWRSIRYDSIIQVRFTIEN